MYTSLFKTFCALKVLLFLRVFDDFCLVKIMILKIEVFEVSEILKSKLNQGAELEKLIFNID